MAQVVDRIKQGLGDGVHTALAGVPEHYAGASLPGSGAGAMAAWLGAASGV